VSAVPPKADVSVAPQLCLRRIGPGRHGLTVGKLYPVKGMKDPWYHQIHDDLGGYFETLGRKPFWQQVWLLPDGTELEALE